MQGGNGAASSSLPCVDDFEVQEETGTRAELIQQLWLDSIALYHLSSLDQAQERVEAAWKLSAGAPEVCAGVTRFVVTDRD